METKKQNQIEEKKQAKSNIVIADDNVQYLKSLERQLGRKYGLNLVNNADQLIAAVKTRNESAIGRYSLIITDNQMEDGHGNSGIYAIREIRKFDQETPIFFHTADQGLDKLLDAFDAGADEGLTKPMNFQELDEKITKYSHGRTIQTKQSEVPNKDNQN